MERTQRTRRSVLGSLGAVGAVSLAGCQGSGDENGTASTDPDPVESEYDLTVTHDLESWARYDPEWAAPTESPLETPLTYEPVVENLEIPWDIAVAPDGDLFLSERTGAILRYDSDSLEDVTAASVLDRADALEPGGEGDWWAGGSEGGLLGIAVHPNYPDVPVVYAFYTYDTDDGYANRLVYYDVEADEPAETETTVIDDIPGHEIAHNGSRIAFGPANYLWVTTGDALRDGDSEPGPALPSDPENLAGKVLRLEPDGSPPADNPDFGEGADSRIFSAGLRNPQGISFLPDGTPLVTSHGDAARDQVLVLEGGEDFGWPEAEDGDGYEGTDFDRPLLNTGSDETWAPSGCVFYTGEDVDVSALSNRLLIGTLRGQHLNSVTVYPADGSATPTDDGGQRFDADWLFSEYDAVSHKLLEDELGRIRHVEQGPNGELYAITSNRDGRADGPWPADDDDQLVRILPSETA